MNHDAASRFLDIAPEVGSILQEGGAVVALESTIITHGMPYPQNVSTAREVESIVRKNGAMPATIAVIGGRIKIGLSDEELDWLGNASGVMKLSRADLPNDSRCDHDLRSPCGPTRLCDRWYRRRSSGCRDHDGHLGRS
jgi:pseudouridine-5'-phosphate glycosidase